MKLDGIHHITCITGDAPRNVDFYARVMGLRLVKKTVNQDDPTVYHLFYGDEDGDPGLDLTFFEYPGVQPGRPGAGMIHRIVWRVGSPDAIGFWEQRLAGEDVDVRREGEALVFSDPEGLEHELRVDTSGDAPLIAEHAEVPAEHALQGFDGARAYSDDPDASRALFEDVLGFEPREEPSTGFEPGDEGWEARGPSRGGWYAYDAAPDASPLQGAGSVHHIAWASEMDDHEEWRRRALEGGARVTPVIDRFYFRSIYFREPSGVLFEIATKGPGFTADEDAGHLGERLSLPPNYEHVRDRVEQTLTPLPDVRQWRPIRS
jgi:glyoxalase family protein